MAQMKRFVGVGRRILNHHQWRVVSNSHDTVLLVRMNAIQQFYPRRGGNGQVQEALDDVECRHGRLVLLQEKTEARVLFNGFRKDGPRFFNTSFVLDEGQIAYRLDKRELVPFGEYVPAGFHWFVEMIGIPMSDLMRGDAVQPLLSLGGVDAGILICYENLYGSVVRTFWQSRSPDFLIVTSNLGWFGRSVLGQHLTMSRMRAMESARPLVSVSNTGMSALVNSRGEIAAMLRTDGPDAATMPLLGATGSPTPYVRLGSWPALLASLVLALCAVLVRLGTARIRAGKVKGL